MAKKVWVRKFDGQKELFDEQKALNSILRAGVNKKNAPLVLAKIESRLYPGISTKEIYGFLHQELKQSGLKPESKFFRLREALGKMGPLDFEKLVAQILSLERFNSEWNVFLQGRCTEHQIDVLASNKGQSYLVEVKRRRNPHRDTGLGEIIELWGRFKDIGESSKNERAIKEAWLVTNTKFSSHAKKFARCRGIRLLGWRYNTTRLSESKTEGLEKILERIGKQKVLNLINSFI